MTNEGSRASERPRVDGQLMRWRASAGLPPDPRPAGVSLAQAIDSLSAELRRVSAETQRVSPGFQIDPVELTLHVTASRSSTQGPGVEWRVLEEGDEQHTGVAHILKLCLGWDSLGRDPKTDVAVQNSDGSEPRPASDRAREHRAETAPDPVQPGTSGNPSAAELASETTTDRLVRLTVYPLWEGNTESSESRLNARLLVKREVATARSEAQLNAIELLRSRYENADTGDRGEGAQGGYCVLFCRAS